MMNIKPIETTYRGYRFRSRLEARWAVFFDALGVQWEYEREGFNLPSGPYLPDFWLPKQSLWLEIKGEQPTDEELRKARELRGADRGAVFIVNGLPGEHSGTLYCWDITDSGSGGPSDWEDSWLSVGPKGLELCVFDERDRCWYADSGFEKSLPVLNPQRGPDLFVAACDEAKAARFEFDNHRAPRSPKIDWAKELAEVTEAKALGKWPPVPQTVSDLPELREHIRGRRLALAGFMEQGASLELDGDLLRVIPRNDIYIRYLNDNRASIAELASELYGRKLQVEVCITERRTATKETT